MKTKFIEATNGPNWGKFMLGWFHGEEWYQPSEIQPTTALLSGQGWGPRHLLVLDLATGEGAIFLPGGLVAADLRKHRIWVCPLFEAFLGWLWAQDLSDIEGLPNLVQLEAPFAFSGYRRGGKPSVETVASRVVLERAAAWRQSFAEHKGEGACNVVAALEERLERLTDIVDALVHESRR